MNDDTQQPIDLSELDPTRDSQRFEALVGGIMEAASVELATRRAANDVVGELAHWRTPVLTAAAAAAIFLVFSFAGLTERSVADEAPPGIAEAIGVPAELAAWVRGEAEPSIIDIYVGVERQ